MDYYINPDVFFSGFAVPVSVADSHLRLAKGDHIKVLLYILRNRESFPAAKEIASATDVSEYDVKEAMLYWADAGILMPKADLPQKEKKSVIKRNEKPQRSDIARRALEDPKISYLLNETQMKLGRTLKQNEINTLVWLYDDQGMDVSLVLFIVQYAVAQNKANIRFIESTASEWIEKGIETVADADREVRKAAVANQAWKLVCLAFGIEMRKPSKKELEASLKWVDEWKISREMLALAYETCVDSKSKFSFPYISKILETWHNKGYKSPEDITEKPKKEKKGDYAAYNLELFEKMLEEKQ